LKRPRSSFSIVILPVVSASAFDPHGRRRPPCSPEDYSGWSSRFARSSHPELSRFRPARSAERIVLDGASSLHPSPDPALFFRKDHRELRTVAGPWNSSAFQFFGIFYDVPVDTLQFWPIVPGDRTRPPWGLCVVGTAFSAMTVNLAASRADGCPCSSIR